VFASSPVAISGTESAYGACFGWYAIRTRPRFERAVCHALDLAGLDSYAPIYSERVRWSDRVKIVDRPLFPGYIFSRFDASIGLDCLDIYGVVHVLPNNLRPLAIPDDEIRSIQIVCDSAMPLSEAEWQPGEVLTVERGPLKGARGVVVRNREKATLTVQIEMLGRAVSVTLPVQDVWKSKH